MVSEDPSFSWKNEQIPQFNVNIFLGTGEIQWLQAKPRVSPENFLRNWSTQVTYYEWVLKFSTWRLEGIDSSQPRVLSDSAGLGADTALLWLGAMLRAWPAHTWVEGLGGGGQS